MPSPWLWLSQNWTLKTRTSPPAKSYGIRWHKYNSITILRSYTWCLTYQMLRWLCWVDWGLSEAFSKNGDHSKYLRFRMMFKQVNPMPMHVTSLPQSCPLPSCRELDWLEFIPWNKRRGPHFRLDAWLPGLIHMCETCPHAGLEICLYSDKNVALLVAQAAWAQKASLQW